MKKPTKNARKPTERESQGSPSIIAGPDYLIVGSPVVLAPDPDRWDLCLKAGDHVQVARMDGLYRHHGIYVGRREVIHYNGEPGRIEQAEVVRTSLESFLNGGRLEILLDEAKFDYPTIVKRAESRLGERRYRLFTSNCEHFVTWCRNGSAKSDQVERFVIGTLDLMSRLLGK